VSFALNRPEISTLLYPPQGETVVSPDLITVSGQTATRNSVSIEHADGRQQNRYLEDDQNMTYVEMNSVGRLTLDADRQGAVVTDSLGGCTGIAGFAALPNGGSTQFVGHFTPSAEARVIDKEMFQPLRAIGSGQSIMQRSPESLLLSPSNLQQFYEFAHRHGAERVDMLVAYGGHREDFYRMFGLGNYIMQTSAVVSSMYDDRYPGRRTLLLPYGGLDESHSLAAGRFADQEGIFWDGIKVDHNMFNRPHLVSAK
jgi:hypothetical protein